MEKINEYNLSHFELIIHVAIEIALKRSDRKCGFDALGDANELVKYLDKYKDLYKIWIRRANRKEDGMSGSIAGDYELYIEE